MLLSVFFAETNQAYDFKLDGNVPVAQLLDEVVGMISQRDHVPLKREPGPFLRCSKKQGRILSKSATLLENGVVSGDELMLV